MTNTNVALQAATATIIVRKVEDQGKVKIQAAVCHPQKGWFCGPFVADRGPKGGKPGAIRALLESMGADAPSSYTVQDFQPVATPPVVAKPVVVQQPMVPVITAPPVAPPVVVPAPQSATTTEKAPLKGYSFGTPEQREAAQKAGNAASKAANEAHHAATGQWLYRMHAIRLQAFKRGFCQALASMGLPPHPEWSRDLAAVGEALPLRPAVVVPSFIAAANG